MFDFLDSDWFIITIEIVFLVFIAFDTKRYFETKKREHLINIVLTIGFFIWASIPFYNSYVTWKESDKKEFIIKCEEDNNASLCDCLDNQIFKEYPFNTYVKLEKSGDTDLKEFIQETKKECLDD